MNIFLKRVGLFLLIFGIYTISMYAINSAILNAQRPDVRSKSTLIAGDSHAKFGLNPNLLNSAANISQTAEPYYATYWKLKDVLPGSSVDTVILGFSYHNLSAFNDKKFEDPFWSAEMFKRTYPIEEFNQLEGVNIDRWTFYKVKFKNMCLYPKPNHIHYIGEYYNTDENDISDYESVIARHYYYNDQNVGISTAATQYLDSIVTLCDKQDVELILISTPLREEYLSRIPENFVRKYTEVKSKMQKLGVHVLDYGNIAFDDSYFLNSDHLNRKGADVFTEEIKTKLARLSGNGNETVWQHVNTAVK